VSIKLLIILGYNEIEEFVIFNKKGIFVYTFPNCTKKNERYMVAISSYPINTGSNLATQSILLCWVVCLFNACLPDNDLPGQSTDVNITCNDKFTGNPLSNEKFEVYSGESGFYLEGGPSVIGEIITDSLGIGTFNFINKKDRYYSVKHRPITWDSSQYYATNFFLIDEGKVNEINFKLKPSTKLNLHLIHEPTTEFNHVDIGFSRQHKGNQSASISTSPSINFSKYLTQQIDTTVSVWLIQEEEYELIIYLSNSPTDGKHNSINKKFKIEREASKTIEAEF
jgi:hypothetical protein